MVEVMIFIARIGCPWRQLPNHFGPWGSVYTRSAMQGAWAAIIDLLAENAKGALRHVDATHVKVPQDGSNADGGQQHHAIGRTKGGSTAR